MNKINQIGQTEKTPVDRSGVRGAVTRIIEHGGKTFKVNEGKFLLKYSDYCDEWIDYVKIQEDPKELTNEHQKIVEVTQDYYEKNGIAPMIRILSKVTNIKSKRISELFPSGPCKMAGLPNAAGWARL
jgi:tRNA 2-thiouridine synthesizing protein E